MPFAVVFRRGQDAVGEAGVLEFGVEVVGVFESGRVAQSYGSLYLAPASCYCECQPCGCLVLNIVGRHELCFDDYGGAVGGGDEDVGLQALVARDGPGTLGADVAAVHHASQDVGEGGVCGWLGVSWHGAVPHWRVKQTAGIVSGLSMGVVMGMVEGSVSFLGG